LFFFCLFSPVFSSVYFWAKYPKYKALVSVVGEKVNFYSIEYLTKFVNYGKAKGLEVQKWYHYKGSVLSSNSRWFPLHQRFWAPSGYFPACPCTWRIHSLYLL
jgi:hypothetical protein